VLKGVLPRLPLDRWRLASWPATVSQLPYNRKSSGSRSQGIDLSERDALYHNWQGLEPRLAS
jgi:hypothetical protein